MPRLRARRGLSGLTIILIAEDAARARAALTLATAHAATIGPVRLFAHERAVRHLSARDDVAEPDLAESGLPDLAQLRAMATASGVSLIACQTGIALAGLTAADMAPGVETGGLVGMLQTLGADRLITV